jgi:hypothetical protein
MKHITAKNIAIAVTAALGLSLAPGAQAADKGCSNASLDGTFGYTATGVLTAPPSLAGPFATAGAQTFDGNGNTTATAWTSQNGSIVQVTVKGTYTVNPDCTGTMTLQVNVPSPPMVIPPPRTSLCLKTEGPSFKPSASARGRLLPPSARCNFPDPGIPDADDFRTGAGGTTYGGFAGDLLYRGWRTGGNDAGISAGAPESRSWCWKSTPTSCAIFAATRSIPRRWK